LAIFSPLTPYPKVPLYQTVRQRLETEALSQELQAPQPSLLDTLKMERKPELDYHLEVEEPSLATAEPWLALLPVVAELKSLL